MNSILFLFFREKSQRYERGREHIVSMETEREDEKKEKKGKKRKKRKEKKESCNNQKTTTTKIKTQSQQPKKLLKK